MSAAAMTDTVATIMLGPCGISPRATRELCARRCHTIAPMSVKAAAHPMASTTARKPPAHCTIGPSVAASLMSPPPTAPCGCTSANARYSNGQAKPHNAPGAHSAAATTAPAAAGNVKKSGSRRHRRSNMHNTTAHVVAQTSAATAPKSPTRISFTSPAVGTTKPLTSCRPPPAQ